MRHYITMCLLAGSLAGSAQQMVPLSYRNYMEKVAEGNLEYAAERLNMNGGSGCVESIQRPEPVRLLFQQRERKSANGRRSGG